MRLVKELAEEIREKTRTILNREILVADANGVVLSGQFLNGRMIPEALKSIQEGRQQTSLLDDGREVRWCPFVFENQTLGGFGVVLEEGPLTPEAVSLLSGLAEVIVHQNFLIDKMQSTETMRSNFTKQVLTSPNLSPDEVYRQADILQLNLRAPQAVILIQTEGLEAGVAQRAANLSSEERRAELTKATDEISVQIRQSFRNFGHNVVAYIEPDRFALLKGIGGDGLNAVNTIRFLREKADFVYDKVKDLPGLKSVTLGVGQYYPDLGGLRKSYQDAKLALEVGSKVWDTGKVYHIKEVGMFVTLANITQERKAELAHQILHPLLRDQQLFKTVRNFLDSGLNLTEAADKLHIHRNTLIYRLDKTKKLINLDPRHFDDALQIKLGLMFYQQATPA